MTDLIKCVILVDGKQQMLLDRTTKTYKRSKSDGAARQYAPRCSYANVQALHPVEVTIATDTTYM